MATTPPFMTFYVADFLADTSSLTNEEEGAYIRLLSTMWALGGRLPDDDARLARITHQSVAKWRKMRAILMNFFTFSDGFLTQKRLAIEYEKALRNLSQRVEAGNASARSKALKSHKPHSTSVPTAAVTAVATDRQRELPIVVDDPFQQSRAGTYNYNQNHIEKETVAPLLGRFPPKAFDDFWSKYPHKRAQEAGRKAFAKVARSGKVQFPALMAALDDYIRFKPEPINWCNPATWLNDGRWNDDWSKEKANVERGYPAQGPQYGRGGLDGLLAEIREEGRRYDEEHGIAPRNQPPAEPRGSELDLDAVDVTPGRTGE